MGNHAVHFLHVQIVYAAAHFEKEGNEALHEWDELAGVYHRADLIIRRPACVHDLLGLKVQLT